MQQRLLQALRHEDTLPVPVRQGAALSVPVLHEDGQVLVEYVRARTADAQRKEAADYRHLQAVESALLRVQVDDRRKHKKRSFVQKFS